MSGMDLFVPRDPEQLSMLRTASERTAVAGHIRRRGAPARGLVARGPVLREALRVPVLIETHGDAREQAPPSPVQLRRHRRRYEGGLEGPGSHGRDGGAVSGNVSISVSVKTGVNYHPPDCCIDALILISKSTISHYFGSCGRGMGGGGGGSGLQ